MGQARSKIFLQKGLDRPFRKTRSDLPVGANQPPFALRATGDTAGLSAAARRAKAAGVSGRFTIRDWRRMGTTVSSRNEDDGMAAHRGQSRLDSEAGQCPFVTHSGPRVRKHRLERLQIVQDSAATSDIRKLTREYDMCSTVCMKRAEAESMDREPGQGFASIASIKS